ncbi:MAG: tannase/feruloyl esterase family alpha/beta hydrolase, partial [Acidobacteriota bacterium]|nr:tannase/feruloyl esterase family alpha/beta hydrolase [Acidobacteriota bacterium]
VVTSDGGHQDASNLASEAAFGLDPESRKDYNYRSTKLVSDVAKQLLAHYYARPVQRAYFMGCSNGGREGMQMAERYPDAFDGVLAGAPAFDLTHAAIAEAWNTQQVASISPKGADGKPDLQRGLTEDDLKLVVHAVLEKCDALDGLKDGMIFNTAACHFDPSVLTCQEGKADGCLSAAKVKVIAALFSGPKDSQGRALYSSWPFDSGLAEAGWRVWITGLGPTPAINTVVTHGFYNGLALQGQGPKVEAASFDFDRDSARILAASADINATATDWSAFARHGAKLLLYHGVSDPIFSADDLVRYYRELEAANGGRQRTQEFARLFLVPGMNHCSGGPALDNFDALGTLQQWVEQDKAPARIVATGRAFPGRSRPLCPYPQYAQYDGKGNPEDAASFACKSESR